MMGIILQRALFLACVASVFVFSQGRPSNEAGDKKYEAQDIENLKGDLQWESQWWTPPEAKDIKNTKDSWKVFKTEKPAVRRRWWEEDWDEDNWWAPKDSSINNKINVLDAKKGEDKTVSSSKYASPASSAVKLQQETSDEEPIPAPKALPLISISNGLSEKSSYALKSEEKMRSIDRSENVKVPLAESPREQLNPTLKGDAIISPFEDPKPGPYSGPRDEVPSQEQWEYHQLTGFGKYIDQGKGKEAKQIKADEKHESEDEKNAEDDYPSKMVSQEEIQVEKDDKNVNIPEDSEGKIKENVKVQEESEGKLKEQFYGFGLESAPDAVVSEAKEKKTEVQMEHKLPLETSKLTDVELNDISKTQNKENYNKGIIYDVIPGAPEQTHSVKKFLTHSVKKDLSKEYMEDVVSTKANPQTSPNPPPPGIAEGKDTETTPLVPSKTSSKSEMTKFYIKSRPLKYCKLDEECRKGRMCRNGMCVCLPSDGCTGHYKPVCGSDGVEYPSHCELHRVACVTHVHIKVDHVGHCLAKHEKVKQMQQIAKDNYKDHLLPQSSSQSAKNDNEEDDSEEYDNSDYDEFDYEDDEEDVDIKEGGNDYDDDDDNEVHEWLESDSKKLTLDSKKVYDYSKDLKKASMKKEDKDKNKVGPSPWDSVKEETGQEYYKGGQQDNMKGSKEDSSEEGQNSKDDYDYQSDGGYKECSKIELAKFKRQLLEHHCKRFEETNCKLELKEERDYLTNLMFSYLDMNTDYQLSYQELKSRQESENFDKFNDVCKLTDLIWYDDVLNADGRLSLDEFEQAFNNMDVSRKQSSPESEAKGSPLAPVVHVIPTLATVGNGLELKCGLTVKSSDVIWRRHGVSIHDLGMVELLVLDDGSLFFSKMGVHHMGNYSCEDSTDPSALQVHSLKVQMPPIVRVSPHSQIEPAELNVKLKCHAEGVPKPTISWKMNDVPITMEPHHYDLEDKNELLLVYNSEYERDTGAYKCVAKNQAGTSEDVASVFIIGEKERTLGMGFTSVNSGKFAVFHNDGYTAYNPDNCLKDRSVHGDFGYFKFIPDNLDGPLRLCENGQDCSWGEVVNVKNSFLFASQPAMNRVVVIETTKNFIPVQVIATDKHPVQLHYVEHLDQVWVLCWNGEADDSTKTIVVIRDASKFVQHHSVHTQPVGNHFDQVQDLFIAPSNDLRHAFDYGYVIHNGQQGLTKLDLDSMRYVKAVDLTSYDCVPRSVAFVPIGGHVVVECVSPLNHQTLQLVMDYITDAVISTAVLSGRPYVSPDSRHVVTVDDLTGKVSVAGVSNEGTLEAAYEVTVSASISDVAFFSTSGHGYLLVLTSADDNDIITINLSAGEVGKLKGTNHADVSSEWHPSAVKRAITSGDVFANFLLAPSKSSLSIMDMKFHEVRCEYTDLLHSKAAVFIGH